MIYSIENKQIKITASTYGAELHSVTGKKKETEYLWNGNPEYWKYHAPHLFPIIGKLKNSKYRVDGIEYELPSHGFARISEFTFISQTDDSITFQLKYSDELLKVYPYKFLLQIKYVIEGNNIIVNYTVENLDEKEIYFSIGAHPAFMCPIDNNELLEDYYLKFNKLENNSIMCFNEETYFSHDKKKYLNNSDIINLKKEIFKDDALVFDDLNSDKITIESKNHNKCLSVDFKGFPNMGIWAPASGAPFVCIEPWFGHADYYDFNGEFKDKEGILSLGVGKEFNCRYIISIKE